MPSNLKSRKVRLRGHHDLKGFSHGGQITVTRKEDHFFAFIGHMKDLGTSILNVTNPEKPLIVAQLPVSMNIHSHKVRVRARIVIIPLLMEGLSIQLFL